MNEAREAREAAERVADRMGWTLEVHPRSVDRSLEFLPKGMTLLEAMETAQSGWILDGKVLRILPRGAARDFWERWAAERKKR